MYDARYMVRAHVNWTTKTAEEKEKLFNDFMSYKPRKRPDGF